MNRAAGSSGAFILRAPTWKRAETHSLNSPKSLRLGGVFLFFKFDILIIMVKLSFLGGAQEVTGSNHLLETNTTKLLIDCGLFQGSKVAEDKNHEPFKFNPKEIDVLLVTHAHLDHIGRIPKLVRDGFRGKIISTLPTRDFATLMLEDSLGILTKEAVREKKEPIYREEDIAKAMTLWEKVEYGEEIKINDLKIIFRNAGHILGSAMIEIQIGSPATGSGPKKIFFSGDLGNPPTPLLNDPYEITDADYLILESTYGSTEHESREGSKMKIERAIEQVVKSRGVLMVPAFSIERTQELLFEINELAENHRIPQLPIFLDSPLAIKATEIYKKYESYYNKEAKYIIASGDDVFNFPGLKFTLTTEESKEINNVPPPKVVIAGSGMSVGGRIIHHERRYLSDPNSILLLVGFQAAGSLGRRLQDGTSSVNILGEDVLVRAKIETITGYSSHPDVNGLFKIVEKTADTAKKVFVVQGEAKTALFFTQKIRDYCGVDALAPKIGDSFELAV